MSAQRLRRWFNTVQIICKWYCAYSAVFDASPPLSKHWLTTSFFLWEKTTKQDFTLCLAGMVLMAFYLTVFWTTSATYQSTEVWQWVYPGSGRKGASDLPPGARLVTIVIAWHLSPLCHVIDAIVLWSHAVDGRRESSARLAIRARQTEWDARKLQLGAKEQKNI